MPDNTLTVVGNLTREIEMRFSNSGMAIANFGIAVNDRRKTASGEYEDETHFFDVSAFGSLAENVSESLSRGNRVIVNGKLRQSSWENSDGEKRSKVEILADSIGVELRWATATPVKNEKRS